MSNYSRIIRHCWEKLLGDTTPSCSYFFSKNDLEISATELGLHVKNIADIRYTFDSREPLPFSSEYGILQVGKGKYAFVPVASNLIDIPPIDTVYAVKDNTPAFAKKYLSNDEQSAITRLMNNDCFSLIPDIGCVHRLQDHWRTNCSFGQVEVDGVASAQDANAVQSILLISAKQYPNKISKTYIYNLGRLASEKFPGEEVKIVNVYCAGEYFIIWTCTAGNAPDDIKIGSCTACYLY
jgi:hypothetical protein